MQENLPYHEFEAELPDTIFGELFDIDNSYHEVSNDDNIFYETNNNENLGDIAQEILDNIEGKDESEAYEHVAEAWPALIPIIAALAPMVIQAATKLAPMAVKAAGNLVGKFSKAKPVPRRPQRIVPAQHVRPQPLPIRTMPIPIARIPCNCNCSSTPHIQNTPQVPAHTTTSTGIGGTLGKIGQGALGTLAGLLSNKNVQGIISGLASKGISKAIKLGSTDSIAREGALLNVIEYLASQAQLETSDDQFPDALDYLIGMDGEFVTDLQDAESRALRFIELYTS